MREETKIDRHEAAASVGLCRTAAALAGWSIVLTAALAGCGSPVAADAAKKSVAGESCTKTDDCAGDLRCVGAVCQVSDSGGSDISASDNAAVDSNGAQVTDAVATGGDASDAPPYEPGAADAVFDLDATVLNDAVPDATPDVTVDSHDTTWFTFDTVNFVDVPDVQVQADTQQDDVPLVDLCAGKLCTSTDPCVVQSCNPATGACEIADGPDGTPCDTNLVDECATHACKAGVCVPVPKQDGLACSPNLKGECNAWTCQAGTCTVAALDGQPCTADLDPCTVDACAGYTCQHTFVSSVSCYKAGTCTDKLAGVVGSECGKSQGISAVGCDCSAACQQYKSCCADYTQACK